jgi:hypothetical protein
MLQNPDNNPTQGVDNQLLPNPEQDSLRRTLLDQDNPNLTLDSKPLEPKQQAEQLHPMLQIQDSLPPDSRPLELKQHPMQGQGSLILESKPLVKPKQAEVPPMLDQANQTLDNSKLLEVKQVMLRRLTQDQAPKPLMQKVNNDLNKAQIKTDLRLNPDLAPLIGHQAQGQLAIGIKTLPKLGKLLPIQDQELLQLAENSHQEMPVQTPKMLIQEVGNNLREPQAKTGLQLNPNQLIELPAQEKLVQGTKSLAQMRNPEPLEQEKL